MDCKMEDQIFLLSDDEYKMYRERISDGNYRWWLRSPGYTSDTVACVYSGSCIDYFGNLARYSNYAVRPALKIRSFNLQIGERVIKYDFPWIVIDDGLAIAEVPIGFRRFDSKSNDYENSEIRKWLFEWRDERYKHVVRCKDCKHSRTDDSNYDCYRCELTSGRAYFASDYCSYFERRENEID